MGKNELKIKICMIFNTNHVTNFIYALFVPKSSRSELNCRNSEIVKYGIETISYLAPKIWSLVPEAIKTNELLDAFKSKIRK